MLLIAAAVRHLNDSHVVHVYITKALANTSASPFCSQEN